MVDSTPAVEIRERRILVDGEPSMVMAGEIHYFRVPRQEWAARLDQLIDVGCTCVASYIPWLVHELPDGSIDLDGRTRPERDLGAFIDLCAERGLTFLARPGPFVMAELKNEGLPFRVIQEHPEILPVGWDGKPTGSHTVDYLAPAFLDEAERWYAAVMPVLARRSHDRGGPVIAVQLDNEIGMLAWVTNSPDLTEHLLTDFRRWCTEVHGEDLTDRYPFDVDDPVTWASAVRSPDEAWASALRVDLGRFMRRRFTRYVEWLAEAARRHGVTELPFLINIHGCSGASGITFAIGVSQLFESYRGVPGFAAGSDHYLGDMSLSGTTDMHFINAVMAAVNGPDQPLTSLEFSAGSGDYGGGLEQRLDEATTELKTRLCVAQGNRLINYYLLAGGTNPRLDRPVGDGNDRIAHTGELHGTSAPIGPQGERGLTYDSTRRAARAVSANARWLADMDEEYDDLTIGFWPDAFMTEYRHPDSATMAEVVQDLTIHRGPGRRRALWRSLLYAGYRFTATNLQDPGRGLPGTVALSTGTVLGADVQQRLAEHFTEGGRLLLLGEIPGRDTEGAPCHILRDALGVTAGESVSGSPHYKPAVDARRIGEWMPEVRVGQLTAIRPVAAHRHGEMATLITDIDGRVCGVEVTRGSGRAIVVTAEVPSHPRLFRTLLERLDCPPGLDLRTSLPGVVATTGVTSDGGRLVHVLNPYGYDAEMTVSVGDPTGLLDQPLTLPARTGRMLPLGLPLPGGGVIVSANAEVTAAAPGRLELTPGLGDSTLVHLQGVRDVTTSDEDVEIVVEGDVTRIAGPAGRGVSLRHLAASA